MFATHWERVLTSQNMLIECSMDKIFEKLEAVVSTDIHNFTAGANFACDK